MGSSRKRRRSDLGDRIVEGARQAVAVARGKLTPSRVRRCLLTIRNARAEPPPQYDAHHIQRVRQSLHASQSLFADVLNVSRETVKAWEQGKRTPDGATLRLLEIAERQPKVLLETVVSC